MLVGKEADVFQMLLLPAPHSRPSSAASPVPPPHTHLQRETSLQRGSGGPRVARPNTGGAARSGGQDATAAELLLSIGKQ